MENILKKSFEAASFIRLPNLLMVGYAQVMAAYFLADQRFFLHEKFWLLSISTIIIAASGYIINDYYDVKIDFINRPEKVVVDQKLTRRQVMTIHTILNFMGIFLGVLVSIWIGLINFLSAFLLWLYSNQLKRLPAIGNIVVSLLTSAVLLELLILYGKGFWYFMAFSSFAFATSLMRELIKDIEDMKGDAAFGCRTLPIVLGIRPVKWIIFIISLGFMVATIIFALKIQIIAFYGFLVIMGIVMMVFNYQLYYADTRKKFGFLSDYLKMIMIFGITSIALF